jgi:hypothetical protein
MLADREPIRSNSRTIKKENANVRLKHPGDVQRRLLDMIGRYCGNAGCRQVRRVGTHTGKPCIGNADFLCKAFAPFSGRRIRMRLAGVERRSKCWKDFLLKG